MSEPLVVAVVLEPAATRIALWQGAAQRIAERIPHGGLALAAHDAPSAALRRGIRRTAVLEVLAGLGEDAMRPDAFVALGAGTAVAGVYVTRESTDDEAADSAALVHTLGATAGVPAFAVEPLDAGDASILLDSESALLVRAAARRDAAQRPGSDSVGRVVLSLEPSARAYALKGERIVASVAAPVRLPAVPDALHLMQRSEQGDAAAADQLAAFAGALHMAAQQAAHVLQDVLVVVMTGTLAVHALLANEVARLVRGVAPVHLLPGARVERALADAARDALLGRTAVRSYG